MQTKKKEIKATWKEALKFHEQMFANEQQQKLWPKTQEFAGAICLISQLKLENTIFIYFVENRFPHLLIKDQQ